MATVPYFAAKLSGYDVAFFDGSWEIWAMDESDPVEQTPPPPKVEKK
jgi:3-mercaptopyruvate sulfurtransferase SseA